MGLSEDQEYLWRKAGKTLKLWRKTGKTPKFLRKPGKRNWSETGKWHGPAETGKHNLKAAENRKAQKNTPASGGNWKIRTKVGKGKGHFFPAENRKLTPYSPPSCHDVIFKLDVNSLVVCDQLIYL